MLAIPPCGASSNIALWRAKIKPPVELVVGDLETVFLIYVGYLLLMVSLMEDGILLVVSQYPSVAGVPNIQFFSTLNTSLNSESTNVV